MLSISRRIGQRLSIDESGNDHGFSLIELLVAMVIASVVGAFSIAWFVGASNATTTTTDSDFGTANARTTLQAWGRMLQLSGAPTTSGTNANGMVSISPTSISFSAYLNNSGSCIPNTQCAALTSTAVTLALSNSQLVQTLGTGSSSVVETYPTSLNGSCLFTAYTSAGSLGCSAQLTAAQLASVTSVSLAFNVSTTSGHSRSFQTSAALTSSQSTSGVTS